MVLLEFFNVKKAYENKVYLTLYLIGLMSMSILFLKFISPNIYGDAATYTYFILLLWVAIFMVIIPKLYVQAEEVCPINWHPLQKNGLRTALLLNDIKILFLFLLYFLF